MSQKKPIEANGFRKKTIEIDQHSSSCVFWSLCQRLKEVNQELSILRIANVRNLTNSERWQLPINLKKMSREELQEQIDPWRTLISEIEDLAKTFDPSTF